MVICFTLSEGIRGFFKFESSQRMLRGYSAEEKRGKRLRQRKERVSIVCNIIVKETKDTAIVLVKSVINTCMQSIVVHNGCGM